MEIELASPAKLNLFLKVLGKRGDGYHEIASLLQPLSLCDTVRVKVEDAPSNGTSIILTTDDKNIPTDRCNLAWAAAEIFLREAKLSKKVDIHIEKRIPVGAGLGGGSSNGATVLMALNTLLSDPLDSKTMLHLALSLGSDVPFFLLGTPAIMRGRGETLEMVDLCHYDYVLINPGFEVSAAWAYGNLPLTKFDEDNTLLYLGYAKKAPEESADILSNDLEDAVVDFRPEIGVLKEKLIEAGASGALMSGSGPTVFGLFPDTLSASEAFERLSKELQAPNRVYLAKGL